MVSKLARQLRSIERARYIDLYSRHNDYLCKGQRLPQTQKDIATLPCRGSYLDVGCGTRQMLDYAMLTGFYPVIGFDHACTKADLIASALEVPFKSKSFDVVVMLDVLEHLVPGDELKALSELNRVAKKHILVSACNKPSVWDGFDLHINKKPYEEWAQIIKAATWPAKVYQMPGHHSSPMWRIDLLSYQ